MSLGDTPEAITSVDVATDDRFLPDAVAHLEQAAGAVVSGIVSTDTSSSPDAVEQPVTKSLISLDYESSGEETDLWELENGPVASAAIVSAPLPISPSLTVPRLPISCPNVTPNLSFNQPSLFDETRRIENLTFPVNSGSTLDEGHRHLSDYLQSG